LNILAGIGIYLCLGVIVLGILDLATKRIRTRLFSASQDTRDKLITSGSFVSTKEATVLIIGAMWLFWPLAIYSALVGGKSGKKG